MLKHLSTFNFVGIDGYSEFAAPPSVDDCSTQKHRWHLSFTYIRLEEQHWAVGFTLLCHVIFHLFNGFAEKEADEVFVGILRSYLP